MLNERRDETAEGPEPEIKHNAETGVTREEKENKGRKAVDEKKQEVKSNMLIEGRPCLALHLGGRRLRAR